MGHSPSLSSLASSQQKFDEFLADREKTLGAEARDYIAELDTMASEYFTGNHIDDQILVTNGHSLDFQHEKETNFSNLKKVIDSIGGALFENKPSPRGIETDSQGAAEAQKVAAEKFGEEAVSSSDTALYVTSKVFEVLSSVITDFNSGTTVEDSIKTVSQNIGFGMHLFCKVKASDYKSKEFFHDETIFEFIYAYRVYFSTELAVTNEKENQVKLIENTIAALTDRYEDLTREVATDTDITAQTYEDNIKIWQTLIAQNDAALKKLELSETPASMEKKAS